MLSCFATVRWQNPGRFLNVSASYTWPAWTQSLFDRQAIRNLGTVRTLKNALSRRRVLADF